MNLEAKLTRKVNYIFEDFTYCWEVLEKTLALSPSELVTMITASDLRGRGGAGFPTGLKWKFAQEASGDEKYVICNADEGEPGTFKDREILERQPEKVFLGMVICGKAIGARTGYIYLRGEYAYLLEHLGPRLDAFHGELRRRGVAFSIEIRLGSGAYVCGEETALIESLEGKRGEPRNKPPYPAVRGFRDCPTVVNNVETLVYCTLILHHGPEHFQQLVTKDSRGSKLFCVSGDTEKRGIYELELGMTLQQFTDLFSDGFTKAVQVGGPSGFCVARKDFASTVIGFEGIPTGGSMMLFNSTRSMYNILHNFLEFFCEESCGQCTPCRVGCQQLLLGIEAVKRKELPPTHLDTLRKLAATMRITAKCGLGQSVPNCFTSIVENFREEIVY